MTVPITDYSSLSSAINNFPDRSYGPGEIDRFIGLAEAEFRLELGPNFARETNVTISPVAGSVALPSGFLRPLSLVHATYGSLDQRSIAAVRDRRIWDTGSVPSIYAVTGTTIEVAPLFTGDLSFDYEGTLTGLSGSNTTNWLITNAPQVYLAMCLSMEKVYNEDWQAAAMLRASAMQTLNSLGIQSTVAQFGRASVNIPGMTP